MLWQNSILPVHFPHPLMSTNICRLNNSLYTMNSINKVKSLLSSSSCTYADLLLCPIHHTNNNYSDREVVHESSQTYWLLHTLNICQIRCVITFNPPGTWKTKSAKSSSDIVQTSLISLLINRLSSILHSDQLFAAWVDCVWVHSHCSIHQISPLLLLEVLYKRWDHRSIISRHQDQNCLNN